MRMLQSILLATDLRSESEGVARVALDLARSFGARVTLLHVLEPLPIWPMDFEEEKALLIRNLRGFAREIATAGVSLGPCIVEIGAATPTIVRKADEFDADLIVVGAGPGSSKAGPFHAGTIAEMVMEHAAQPVLAVRPGNPRASFRKVLCPVDHSAISRRGLRNAIHLTRAFAGELHVLSVVPPTTWLGSAVETATLTHPRVEHERLWYQEFGHFLEGIDFHGLKWTREVRRGEPAEEIALCAHERSVDVIVMGSTGRSGLVRMLMGSVTRRVLRRLPCSLVTVKDRDAVQDLLEEDVRQANLLMAEGRELMTNGCYLPALVKLRQVTAINPFHVESLEAQADAYEKVGQRLESNAYRKRVEQLRRHDETPAH